MARRNAQLKPTLHRKQKLESLARNKPAGTLSWLAFDHAQPNRWFSRGSIVEPMHWMVLHRPVELAAHTGDWVLKRTRVAIRCAKTPIQRYYLGTWRDRDAQSAHFRAPTIEAKRPEKARQSDRQARAASAEDSMPRPR